LAATAGIVNVSGMLLIAVGLTVVLVAADLLDVTRRASARRARPHG
jgi:hypothetical protein